MNASPAPTVSLTTTFGAGTQTRVLRSHSAAPAAPMVTQIRGVFVASERAAQASATASALPGGLGVGSPVRSHEAIWPTSSWFRLMTSAWDACSTIRSGSADRGRKLKSHQYDRDLHARRRSDCSTLYGERPAIAPPT